MKAYQGWFHTRMMKEDHQSPPVSKAVAISPAQRNQKVVEILLEHQTKIKSEENILLSGKKIIEIHTYLTPVTAIIRVRIR